MFLREGKQFSNSAPPVESNLHSWCIRALIISSDLIQILKHLKPASPRSISLTDLLKLFSLWPPIQTFYGKRRWSSVEVFYNRELHSHNFYYGCTFDSINNSWPLYSPSQTAKIPKCLFKTVPSNLPNIYRYQITNVCTYLYTSRFLDVIFSTRFLATHLWIKRLSGTQRIYFPKIKRWVTDGQQALIS